MSSDHPSKQPARLGEFGEARVFYSSPQNAITPPDTQLPSVTLVAVFPRTGVADESPGASVSLGVTLAWWGHKQNQQVSLGEWEITDRCGCAGSEPCQNTSEPPRVDPTPEKSPLLQEEEEGAKG